jgi:hypothetical protein
MVGYNRRAPPEPSHAHEHEWAGPDDDSGFIYEDGAMYITEHCRYSEERAAGHSDRLDETFYETMYACEASRFHRFDLTKIEHVYFRDDGEEGLLTLTAGESVFDFGDDVPPELLEAIEHAAREKLTKPTDDYDEPQVHDWVWRDGVDTDDHHVEVEVGGETYRLTYSHTEAGRV